MEVPFLINHYLPNLSAVAISAVGVFTLVPGLAYGQHQPAPDSEFNQQIDDFRNLVVSTMESRDAEGYASLFTKEAVVMPKDGSRITGRGQIREWSKDFFGAF